MRKSLSLTNLTKAECAYIMGIATEIEDNEENISLDVVETNAENEDYVAPADAEKGRGDTNLEQPE